MLYIFHITPLFSLSLFLCIFITGVNFWVSLHFRFPLLCGDFFGVKLQWSSSCSLCAQCCEKRRWMPWIVLLFLRRRSATKELLKLGMSCFSIPHLLKRSFSRNLMLWVCSQTPKKATSPKHSKNNVKGRTRHHKKRHWVIFRSPRKATTPKPLKNNLKGRTPYHKKRCKRLFLVLVICLTCKLHSPTFSFMVHRCSCCCWKMSSL